MSYGKSIGGVIGATMVVGAVSKLVPKKKYKTKVKRRKK